MGALPSSTVFVKASKRLKRPLAGILAVDRESSQLELDAALSNGCLSDVLLDPRSRQFTRKYTNSLSCRSRGARRGRERQAGGAEDLIVRVLHDT